MFYWDYTMIILLPAMILAIYAQAKVTSTFERYLRVPAKSGMTGADVAREILKQSGIYDVSVQIQGGRLSDYYDPRRKVLKLSRDVYNGSSLAALGVAAHECGHAIQHNVGYAPLAIRNAIVPAAGIGSQMAFPLFFLGLLFRADSLMLVGILLFSLAVLFQIITLPVEYNASNRAVAILESGGFIDRSEVGPVKAVLGAAALTYVAATLTAVMQLLRLLVLAGAGRDRK
ncbi:putative membrane protease YugP [Tepidanaerobacter acetatoxydans Re1]|uniref:Putative membrane protease YugP n=1 Tax=Tepidanaerobacter acetatoxydans (strain DSM 21804 / JCM 16047 / Re1) TaxID=1209989 RepID=F4LRG7_TEPAE|nr:zinc metallopeptidase [Tepidanaerobacter acetatoxydans]AEE90230.1 peptidase membrane zinc metallopeptidase [Tepidanaerobacter acetatoxydans Re1]CCP24692.1 putative membrane protease YugP [Tepidanaerobacter acetatoxydans Re1]